MRRADRLFQIIQILRRARRPVTAARLAEELEVSVRTVYRDIADLMAQDVPVRGEAGIGYQLGNGFHLPPLMLTPDEIEALVLGAKWVQTRDDPVLDRAARDLIAKINAVVPSRLRPLILESTGLVPDYGMQEPDRIDIVRLRTWIRAERRIEIAYRDAAGAVSERVIWPLALAYFETVRLIVAWCEHRRDFRHFRTDRIVACRFLEETYPELRRSMLDRWQRTQCGVQPVKSDRGVTSRSRP